MSSPYVDQYMRRLRNRLERELGDTGEQVVADLAILCSDPWPPSSKPGNPPHARSGEYVAGWFFEVRVVGPDQITLEISNHQKKKLKYLERGTKRAAARPVLDRVDRKWRSRIKRAIAAALNP